MTGTEVQAPAREHRVLGLVVHGIGQQSLGATLKHVLEGFLPLVRLIDPGAGISARPLDRGDPTDVMIRFRGASQKTSRIEGYEMRFKEVWWASTFEPPSIGEMVAGVPDLVMNVARRRGARGIRAFGWLVWAAIRRGTLDVWHVAVALVCSVLAFVLAPASWRWNERFDGDLRWLLQRVARGQTALAELLVLVLSPAVLALVLMPLRVIEFAVPANLRFEGLSKFRLMLIGIFTEHLGDMWLYLNRPWEASRIRVRLEDRFREIVDEMNDPLTESRVECVMVISHSMGAVVTYEALTGRRMRDLLEKHFGGEGQPKLIFVTVGAGLNLAWQLVPSREEARLVRPCSECLEWHDFWSKLDPVPRGALMPPKPLTGARESHEVVNQMDVFSDHTAYWNNAEQVLAPLLDLATDHHFDDKLCLDQAAREKRVYVLSALKGLTWLAAPVAAYLLAFEFSGWTDWLTDQAFAVLGVEVDLPAALVRIGAALAGAAAVVVAYSTLVKCWWNSWDNRVKHLPAR